MRSAPSWHELNQRYLVAALAGLRARLGGETGETDPTELEHLRALMPAPPALESVGDAFGLSEFERALLLLCAGIELDASMVAACASAQGDPNRPYPTLALALAVLPGAHWSAITPDAPLRRWRLLEIGMGSSLVASPLRIDEHVLHHLTGLGHLDERLVSLVEPVDPPSELAPSHRRLVERLATAWSTEGGAASPPLLQLCGADASANREIAASVCALLGLELAALPAHLVPVADAELDQLVRIWQRESALGSRALLVDCADLEPADAAREWAVDRLLRLVGHALVSTPERRRAVRRPSVSLDVGRPSREEQRDLWQGALAGWANQLDGQLDRLVAHFDVGTARIRAASMEALSGEPVTAGELAVRLWEACRVQARPRIEDLAQRLVPKAGWYDLVLPEPQLAALRQVSIHVRERTMVYETWGFAVRTSRGLGISALFAGPSGTGKTLAAEVLAHELSLDLFRVDLSRVVSKYIGETEKNLRRIFDAAEEGGAVLLFDEADALFGKRTEVRDSHDRYANIEVSYLLQRMEAYGGLAILTTNQKAALDQAFLRRLRFVVQFPFPDVSQRTEIWRRAFPAATPTEGLEPERLARLNLAGGNIANIAMNAAFVAADAGQPVRMTHVVAAARTEYAKLEKPLTETELGGGW